MPSEKFQDQVKRDSRTLFIERSGNTCPICFHSPRGFFFQLKLDPRHPQYAFCSMACCNGVSNILGYNGMIDLAKLTEMERESIADARRLFWKGCEENGLGAAVMNLSEKQIDQVIAHAVEGFRAAMQQRSLLNDQIPF